MFDISEKLNLYGIQPKNAIFLITLKIKLFLTKWLENGNVFEYKIIHYTTENQYHFMIFHIKWFPKKFE